MVTINYPGSNNGPSQVVGVAIQPDGKIVAGISNVMRMLILCSCLRAST